MRLAPRKNIYKKRKIQLARIAKLNIRAEQCMVKKKPGKSNAHFTQMAIRMINVIPQQYKSGCPIRKRRR